MRIYQNLTIDFDNGADLEAEFDDDGLVSIKVAADPDQEAAGWTFAPEDIDDLILALEAVQEKARDIQISRDEED